MCHTSYNSSLNRPIVYLADRTYYGRAYATVLRLSIVSLYGMYCG